MSRKVLVRVLLSILSIAFILQIANIIIRIGAGDLSGSFIHIGTALIVAGTGMIVVGKEMQTNRQGKDKI